MNAEFECHTKGDSRYIDEVPLISESCLLDDNTDGLTQSSELGRQFIKRSSPHEDVMDEINSTFKFAKMETPSFSNKSGKIKSDGPSMDPSKGSDLAKVPQRKFPFKSPSDSAPDEFLDKPSRQPNLQSDPELSRLTHGVMHPTIIVSSSLPSFANPHRPKSEVFTDSMSQGESRLALTLVDQDIIALNTGSTHQPTPSSKGDVLCSKPVSSSEISSRKSQLFQKATTNNRLRIKQPFPEVAQSITNGNDESAGPQLFRELGKPEPNLSDHCLTLDATLPAFVGDDRHSSASFRSHSPQALQPEVSIAPCFDSQAPGFADLPHSTFFISSNELSKATSLNDNVQQTNKELSLVESRPEVSWQQREVLSNDLSSSTQIPRGKKLHTELVSLKSHEEIFTGTGMSENLMVAGISTKHPDNRHSKVETQVPTYSAKRPLSSCSQQEICYNLTIPIPENSPNVDDELRHDSDSGHITSNNNSSVPESKTNRTTYSYIPPTSEWPPLLSNVILAQQKLIRHSQEVEDILNDYQIQKETAQVQQSELEHLKASSVKNFEEIQTLKTEREVLRAKIKKMELLSIKYKNHMNEVVMAQKHLMREALKIKKVQIDAKLFQASYNSRDEHIKKLESLVHDAKEFRAPAQKLLAMQNENGHLIKLVRESSEINKLLQSDLDKNAIELGRERHNVSQLQKQLSVQTEAHQELIGHVKTIRCDIVGDLTSKGEMLMKIMRSGDSIQEKIKQVLCVVDSVNSCGESLRQACATVPEDISVEMERISKATESHHLSLQESQLQHFEALKAKFDQLHHDQKNTSQLNTIISDIREENATLLSSLHAKEDKCQDLTNRIDCLKSELDNCRTSFNNKSDELAAANASSKENSILQLGCQDLERENRALKAEVDAVNHKTASIVEELNAVRNTLLKTERELHEMSSKFSDAQTLIQEFPKEKKAYTSNAKLDVEKARQEVAKASMAAKTELIMRNDALVNILEQRRVEAELQVVTIKEELKRMQDDRDRLVYNTAQLEDELSKCREKSVQHTKQFERLEIQRLDVDALRQQEAALKFVRVEITELKNILEHIRITATEGLQTAIQTSHGLKADLRYYRDLEHEKESLREQNIILQKKLALSSILQPQLTKAQGLNQSERTTRSHISCGMKSSNTKQADEDLNMENPESGPDTTLTIEAVIPTKLPQANEVRQNGSQPIASEHINTRFEFERRLSPIVNQDTFKSSQLKIGSTLAPSDHREDEVVSSTPQILLNRLKFASRISTTSHEPKPTSNLRESIVMSTAHSIHGTPICVEAFNEEIIPFSDFSPLLLHSQSPVPDVSLMMDNLGTTISQQGIHKLFADLGGNEQNASQYEHNQASKSPKWPKVTKMQPPEPIFNKYNLGYQPPDNSHDDISTTDMYNEQASFTKALHYVPLVQKRKVAQKAPITLKSTLKNSVAANQSTTNPLSTSKTPVLMKSVASGRGINGNRKFGPELGYKRVASGQVIKLKCDSADLNDKFCSGIDVPSPSHQYQFTRLIEKSPLIPGPKRNNRKRSALSALSAEEGPNITKAPRKSLRFESSTDSVDKSPIVADLQAYKPHTLRRQ